MCGIAGFADVGWQGRTNGQSQARLEAEFALVHRMTRSNSLSDTRPPVATLMTSPATFGAAQARSTPSTTFAM